MRDRKEPMKLQVQAPPNVRNVKKCQERLIADGRTLRFQELKIYRISGKSEVIKKQNKKKKYQALKMVSNRQGLKASRVMEMGRL